MKINIPFWVCLALVWAQSTLSLAQGTSQFRLIDADTDQPIAEASFQYGDQAGYSDEQGQISFTYREGTRMDFSHLNYGAWTLDDQQVRQALQTGYFKRTHTILELFPVTVISVRPNQSPGVKLPVEYRDRMAHDAAAILSQSAAFNSIRKGGNYGFDPVFRGFKYDQLNIVLNGAQSATAACPNRMDPPTSQMAPNMTDRIEILKGPHALRYGAGFGATINFVSNSLLFSEKPDWYGRLSGGYEHNGDLLRSEGLVGLRGKNYDLGLLASWSQGNDYTTGNGDLIPADFRRGSFGTILGFQLTSNQELRLSANYNLARDADFPALPMDLREDDTWMFNARHQISFDKERLQSWNTTLFSSLVDHRMDNLLKEIDPRMVNTDTEAQTYNYGGRTEGHWAFGQSVFYAGLDFRAEEAIGIRTRAFIGGPNAGKTFEDNAWQHGRVTKTSMFGEYQQQRRNWQFVLSGRLEWNQANVLDPSADFLQLYAETEQTQINPSVSAGISRKLSPSVRLGLWLGRVQRSGSITERYINYFPVGQDPYEMLGSPDLRPEVNNQADLSFVWKPGKAIVQADVFAAYLQDFISSRIDTTLAPRIPSSPGVRRFVNIGEAFKTGVELTWTQPFGAGLQHQLSLAYTYAQDLERDQPLPEIAPLDFRYALQGAYLKNRLLPEIIFRHVLTQNRISAEFGETETPAFTLLDARLSFQATGGIRLSAGVNNLLDENYYEHLFRSVAGATNPIFAPGRNMYASLHLDF